MKILKKMKRKAMIAMKTLKKLLSKKIEKRGYGLQK